MDEMSPGFVRHNLLSWRNSEMDRDVDLCWYLGNELWCGQMVMRMSRRHILITSLNVHRVQNY